MSQAIGFRNIPEWSEERESEKFRERISEFHKGFGGNSVLKVLF